MKKQFFSFSPSQCSPESVCSAGWKVVIVLPENVFYNVLLYSVCLLDALIPMCNIVAIA